MTGSMRTILEVVSPAGVNPTLSVDTDELGPPSYTDLGTRREYIQTIAPSDEDIAIAIPDCCCLLIVSDEPILLKLADGETQLRLRQFAVGAEDSDAVAITARDLLISGNTSSTAIVQIYAFGVNP